MEISLTGKRAFITAGGAGMGRATAIALDKLGADVFTCDLDANLLSSLAAESNNSIKTFVCDVSDSKAIDEIFDEISPGGLDILINNAGVSGPTKLVEDVTDDE